ncbi:hypothetical protein ANCCAN_15113 [Ancylostoma caninum]|uniref:IF rod domain-containing protein n=1 Tax=Ancylostoma caninum TaxID=29170 RepID=A0A368G3C5_ANCCA|nr:hypothetical protein ANCCAN_15113 [Ancylostoma caninum]
MQIRLAENREIGLLNDRHADYISEVRFLQAVHRKLKMRLDQWMKAGKPGYGKETITEHIANGSNGYGKLKERYDADAEKIPSLNIELNNTRSRYESALRGRDPSAEDSLLVRLCDVRSQICLAKGRGKVIQEECQRLRKENQKLMDDIASQRQVVIPGIISNMSDELEIPPDFRQGNTRAPQLRTPCCAAIAGVRGAVEEMQTGKFRIRKHKIRIWIRCLPHFRKPDKYKATRSTTSRKIESTSVRELRLQWVTSEDNTKSYFQLASTVNSEMEQWYKQQINGIDIKRRDDASSYKKKLADLRAELVDVRTKLAHLEERNRLLTSLIGDFEDARDQEQRISDTCIQDDENHLKKLIERYNELTSGPRDNKYTVATLRAEIMRYRELLDGVGPRSNRDVSAILKSVLEKLDSRIVIRPSGSHDGGTSIGTGVVPMAPIGEGVTSQAHITSIVTTQSYSSGGGLYAPYGSGSTTQIGGGATSQTQIGGGTTYAPYGTGSTTQIGGGASQTQIGGGATSQTYIGGGGTSYTPIGGGATSQTHMVSTSQSYIGGGATSLPQIGTGATSHSQAGSVTGGQIGSGVVVAQPVGQGVSAQDVSSDGSVWSSSRRYSWAERKPATVISTADYTIGGERGARPSGEHREYSMQRSAQGNVTIGVSPSLFM